MKDIDLAVLKNLSLLCRMRCTEQEYTILTDKLRKILQYVDLLDEIPTEDVPPCDHVIDDLVNVLREDEVTEHLLDRRLLLDNAPGGEVAGRIRVPFIIKK